MGGLEGENPRFRVEGLSPSKELLRFSSGKKDLAEKKSSAKTDKEMYMKKKWIAACMAAVCALALVTGCSSETEEPEGIVYDAGEWVIDGTTVWLYQGTARDVHIPAGVTVIGRRAFDFRNEVVESVTIPAGVTIIDDYAFDGCTKLASVERSPKAWR